MKCLNGHLRTQQEKGTPTTCPECDQPITAVKVVSPNPHKISSPLVFRGTLKPWQTKCVKWSESVSSGYLNAIMGSGKTPMSIKIMCDKNYGLTMIVVPSQLISKWRRELLQFTNLSDTQILTYQGSHRSKIVITSETKVIITSYTYLYLDFVSPIIWSPNNVIYDHVQEIEAVIFDEAHYLRNHKTQTYQGAKNLLSHNPNMWMLSGTPVVNDISDYYNQMSLFKNKDDQISMMEWKERNVYQIKKEDMTLDNITKIRQQHTLELTLEDQETYLGLVKETLTTINDDTVHFANVLAKILRLKQMCNHRLAIVPRDDFMGELTKMSTLPKSAKFESIKSIIKDVPTADLIIIFSQWRQSLTLIQEYLCQSNIPVEFFSHATNYDDPLVRGQRRVILLTTQSGGVGLNMTFANHVIFMDLPWSFTVKEQAEDRCYRMGQSKNCYVHSFQVLNTIEHWMTEIVEEKRQLVDSFQEGGNLYHIDKAKLSTLLRQYLHWQETHMMKVQPMLSIKKPLKLLPYNLITSKLPSYDSLTPVLNDHSDPPPAYSEVN